MKVRLLIIAGLLAVTASGCVQAASAAPERRIVVVVDASAGPGALAEARAAVDRAGDGAQLRVPRTPTEQLSVTHYFAAKGYDVVGVGLNRRVAVAPVQERYPNTRFVAAAPGRTGRIVAR
jgi:ABC-type sugar transport system substrate-binding protein